MIKLHKLALVTAFGAFGVSAEAQTCSTLCDKNFWKTASQAEVATEISKADVNARDADGKSALIWAALWSGTAENMKVLLDAGANVNARDADGRTALMLAAGFSTADNVKVLLNAGANVNARTEDGRIALMAAAGFSTADNVKVLLNAGADASLKSADGNTAWDYAQNNEKLKGTDVYWILNDARFK